MEIQNKDLEKLIGNGDKYLILVDDLEVNMLMPKFEIGQKVYAVKVISDIRQKKVDCDVCNSTGYVKVEGRNENFICPMCHANTYTERCGYKYVISYCEATIGKIEIEEYASEYLCDYKSQIRYMLKETGVGSGQVWKEERLFATEKEANEFCEKYMPYDHYDTKAVLRT